jgi:hypothetical protein
VAKPDAARLRALLLLSHIMGDVAADNMLNGNMLHANGILCARQAGAGICIANLL